METLTGREAIEYAEQNCLTLSKYEDPTEEAREGLTPDEAREIATEDPSLIYISRTPRRYEIRILSCGGSNYECSILDLLAETDDKDEAKRLAGSLGSSYQWGTAILDTVEHRVDCGTDENGNPWIMDLKHVGRD